MSLTPQWLDQLRSRTTLSALIGRSVKVIKAGREHKACCPFHQEKTPSFTINDAKGFYHCFGCGAHGDAIRWMTDHQGLPFMDAVKELAAAAGMDLPAPDPKAARRAEQARSLHDVMAAAQAWFVEQLGTAAGAQARAYLDRRGIGPDAISRFGFGFAPDDRGSLKAALSSFPEAMLLEAGLIIQPDDKGRDSYSRFRGRLMLPIRDIRGRVIAFGGRILGEGEPKYLNSPDTPLFDKGRTLYNIDLAAPAARKSDRMLVAEGYMDVVALAQAGFADAVAPLGTALTEHQIERLWQMVETPVLCFDGDAAGQKAAVRAATRALPLLRPGHSLAFAVLPPGLDPDDLIRAQGAEAMRGIIAAAEPMVDLLWRHEKDAAPTTTPEERAGFKQRLTALAGAIGDPDVKAHYMHLWKQRFDAMFFSRIPPMVRTGTKPLQQARGKPWATVPPPPTQEARSLGTGGVEPALARAIIGGLLRLPDVAVDHRESVLAMPIVEPQLARLRDAIVEITDSETNVETGGLLTILAERDLYNVARGLLRADALTYRFASATGIDAEVRCSLSEAIELSVAMPRIETELAEVTRQMRDNLDDDLYQHQLALRQAREDLRQRIADLAHPDELA